MHYIKDIFAYFRTLQQLRLLNHIEFIARELQLVSQYSLNCIYYDMCVLLVQPLHYLKFLQTTLVKQNCAPIKFEIGGESVFKTVITLI